MNFEFSCQPPKLIYFPCNETKLDFTINDSELYLPGFEIVRKDRKINGCNGGRVCFYVRSNLNYNTREDLSTENLAG